VTEILALIPARGGSKALPRKNVLPVAGKPLIAYSIQTAHASTLVTRTVVSTDDEEIASVAREYGAEVPFMRPPALAQDESTDLEAFRHALEWMRDEEQYEPEVLVHLRPTNPVRRVERVEEAIRLILDDPQAHSLRSVSWPEQSPYKMWRIEEGYLRPLLSVEGMPNAHSLPRQRLPEVWWQNGYVDVIRPRTILELGSMSGERVLPFVIDEPFVEIDYADSIERAEALLRSGPTAALGQPRHPA
jgi:CMP-N,N'-diacetyllegionaminic acid synthase